MFEIHQERILFIPFNTLHFLVMIKFMPEAIEQILSNVLNYRVNGQLDKTSSPSQIFKSKTDQAREKLKREEKEITNQDINVVVSAPKCAEQY